MSHETRPRPTRMLICDLCDEEIPEQPWESGMSRGNVMSYIGPINQVTNRTIWALLCWGRDRNRRTDQTVEAVNYDFHGKCIVALVEKEIATRAALDASDETLTHTAHVSTIRPDEDAS